jgi:thiol-disulfide isomerase/thioredoxin
MNEKMEIPKRSASLGIGVLIVLSAWAAGGTAEQRSIRFPKNRSIEQTPTDLDAETVLLQAGVEYDKRPSLLYDCDTIVTWPERKFKPGDRTKLRYVCRVIQDGDRVDGTINVLETVDSNEIPFKESRQIWDGSRFLLRTKLPSMDHHNAYFSQDKSLRGILLQTELKDSFLDGVFPGSGGRHYSSTMLKADDLVLQQKMEEVNGHPCFVVESRDKLGHCTVWIDPEAGYNLRKAIIHRAGESSEKEKLPPKAIIIVPTKSFDFMAQNIELKNIDGIWFPVAGTVEERMVFGDNKVSHWRSAASRDNIIWNPDFDKMGAFKMDLPEGARIRNHDDESNDYVWRNGRPEKVNHIHAEMVGRQAPPLEVEKWYNSQVGGLNIKGKVILLDFFGVWCRPCMAKIPFIKELHKQYSNHGLIVIGVHTAQSSEKIPEFISRDDIKYTIAVDEHGLNAKSFNVFFYPTVVLIDRKGVIKAVNPSETELKELLKLLLEQ